MFTVTLITTTGLHSGYAKRRVLSGHRPVEKYYKIDEFTGVGNRSHPKMGVTLGHYYSYIAPFTPHKLVRFKHFSGVITGHRTGRERD